MASPDDAVQIVWSNVVREDESRMWTTVSGDDVPTLEDGVVVHGDTRGPVQHLQERTIPTPCVRDVIDEVVVDFNMVRLLAWKVVVLPRDVQARATAS